jgi:hypothetical protein
MIDFYQYRFSILHQHDVETEQLKTNWRLLCIKITSFAECIFFWLWLSAVIVPNVCLPCFFIRMQHFGVASHHSPHNDWLYSLLNLFRADSSLLNLLQDRGIWSFVALILLTSFFIGYKTGWMFIDCVVG